MNAFHRVNGALRCEGASVEEIAAAAGTPVYVYSSRVILEQYRCIRDAFGRFDARICFSIKANGNLAVLRLLLGAGAGFDVVSEGEILRALKVGADPASLVFAGVGKTESEIRAALRVGVGLFNVESIPELDLIERIAGEAGVIARVLLRVNPDVDAITHPHVTTGRKEDKFGIDFDTAAEAVASIGARRGIEFLGFHVHIGSQITRREPYQAALARVAGLIEATRKRGVEASTLNLGGGFGISYHEEAPKASELAEDLAPILDRLQCRVILEPGRFIVGNAGILVTEVQYVKLGREKTFVITDAGMSELLRPALYGAFHRIEPVREREPSVERVEVDVVGPLCESGDVLARNRPLPWVERGDLLAVFQAGAYGFSMASNYNSRPRPPEVLVEGDAWRVVRERESLEDLVRGESG